MEITIIECRLFWRAMRTGARYMQAERVLHQNGFRYLIALDAHVRGGPLYAK